MFEPTNTSHQVSAQAYSDCGGCPFQDGFDWRHVNIFETSLKCEGCIEAPLSLNETSVFTSSSFETSAIIPEPIEKLSTVKSSEPSEVGCPEEKIAEFSIIMPSACDSSKPTLKRRGRKPTNTGLTKRKDIVLKSLVRRIKKFHRQRLRKVVKKLTSKRLKYAQLKDYLKDYIEMEF